MYTPLYLFRIFSLSNEKDQIISRAKQRGKRVIFRSLIIFIISSLFFSNLFPITSSVSQNTIIPIHQETTHQPRAIFSISFLETFDEDGIIETSNFYQGNTTMIKCNISHDEDILKSLTVRVTIVNQEKGNILLAYTNMTPIENANGTTWTWYKYNYTFLPPTARGTYDITVKSTINSPTFLEINKSIFIKIINSPPEIIEEIPLIYKFEDAEPWSLNLTKNKRDLEDSNQNLIWKVENVSNELLSIVINKDILHFKLVQNAFGSNRIKLILEDSDKDINITWFWVFVEPENDPPAISPLIPEQIREEDSVPWFINLSRYVFDIEDSNNNDEPIWFIDGVNESLLNVEIVIDNGFKKLKITPVENAYGSNLVTLHVEDTNGAVTWQRVWINITPVDDPPIWKNIQVLELTKRSNLNILHLLEYIVDIDSPKDTLKFSIISKTPSNIISSIDQLGRLSINISDKDYIGSGTILINATDGSNTAETTINLLINLARFTTQLLAPENNSIITPQIPTLYWDIIKPNTLEKFYFDVYLHMDPIKVANRAIAARVANNLKEKYFTSPIILENDKKYYWCVVVKYFDDDNIEYFSKTANIVWNFRIDVNSDNLPPITKLLSPVSNGIVNNQAVNLTWLGYDPDGDAPISYDLYLSLDKESVQNHDASAKIALEDRTVNYKVVSDLKEDKVYYWTVVPYSRGQRGKCANIFNAFGVDLTNIMPTTILILPKNEISISKPPILYWDYIDPDPLETLYFDIYFNENKSLVTSLDPKARVATVKDLTHYYLPSYLPSSITPGKKYYWTVISIDKVGRGICECGVWGFTINGSVKNHPPVAKLLTPKNNAITSEKTVTLTWNGTDTEDDPVSYTIYFSADEKEVSSFSKNAKVTTIGVNSIKISNLTDGLVYYWTIVPDDGKVHGICIDEIWSFQFNPKNNMNDNEEDNQGGYIFTIQLFSVIILIILLITISLWVLRQYKKEMEFEKLVSGDPRIKITDEMKSELLSSSTLRAFHGEHTVESKPTLEAAFTNEIEVKEQLSLKTKEKEHPYPEGDYSYKIEKTRYRPPAGLKAEQIKRAIPYAKGSQKENHILIKKDIKLAKPLSKKIMSDKAIKASSLPISRQCPECGSFKVKTYKDQTNKCLDCKHRF